MIFTKHRLNLNASIIKPGTALFLDRDGVINRRIVGGYVTSPAGFVFLPGVLEALKVLNNILPRIIIVTNQQGIGKGLFSEDDLKLVHSFMLEQIMENGGRIDRIFHSPFLEKENHVTRKPQIGMALEAKKQFPEIELSDSIMVGDSVADMEFGRAAGMRTVFIKTNPDLYPGRLADESYRDLFSFAHSLTK